MTNDKDILKRFMAGDGSACAALLTRLRPAVLFDLRRHYSGLEAAFDEILDAAESRLFEWREQTLKGDGPRIDLEESIPSLGYRLAKQEARIEGRYRRRNRLAKKKQSESDRDEDEEDREKAKEKQRNAGPPSDRTADERVNLGDLEAAIDQLPEEVGLVLMAEAQRVMAGAEPLHEQLGITPEAAHKRLERARKELKERLREREGE